MKKKLIAYGLRLALWLVRSGFDYVDKNKDGKWSMEEIMITAKELDALTKKLYSKIKKK